MTVAKWREKSHRWLLVAAVTGIFVAPAWAGEQANPLPVRIVSIGPLATEIVFALGAGQNVVAVDSASTFPAAARTKPKVGYFRSLTAESVLSFRPELVVAVAQAGPEEVFEHLNGARIPLLRLPLVEDLASAWEITRQIGVALGRSEEAERLLQDLARTKQGLEERRTHVGRRPRVLVLFAPTSQMVLAAGSDTAAAALLALVGAENALDGIHGLKPIGPEGIASVDPEWVVVTEHSLESLGQKDGLWALPGIERTRAARERKQLVCRDVGLLEFGPSFLGCAEHIFAHLHGREEESQVNGAR